MEKLEVSYVPPPSFRSCTSGEQRSSGPNHIKMMKMERMEEEDDISFMKSRHKQGPKGGTSFLLSALALVTALAMFAMVVTWLWGVPRMATDNMKLIKELADRLLNQAEQIKDLEKQVEDYTQTCRLPMAKGECFASIQRWHFNFEEGSCNQFSYTGCKGNANNFHTLNDCQKACETTSGPDTKTLPDARSGDDQAAQPDQPDLCSMKMDMGPCRATIQRWYFSAENGICKEFTYGGCAGNDNNFVSETKCRERCITTRGTVVLRPDFCSEPNSTGHCRAAFPKYYYDAEAGDCKKFIYGGCGGNDNKFDTEDECLKTCHID